MKVTHPGAAFLLFLAGALPAEDLARGTEGHLARENSELCASFSLPAAAAANCTNPIACGNHEVGTFAAPPDPSCVTQFLIGGQTFSSPVNLYTFDGTAGQGVMITLHSTQLNDPVLLLARASDNSVIKVDARRGTGDLGVGTVLTETTGYVVAVGSLSSPTVTTTYDIFLACETGGLPNLVFEYKPTGWPAPVIVSNAPDSFTDVSAPSTTDSLYAHFAETNIGYGPIAGPYLTEVELDGEIVYTLANDNLLPGWYVYWKNRPLGMLPEGPHTLTVRIDPAGAVAETSETDNVFTKSFRVGQRTPSCVPDSLTLCLDGNRFRVRANWFKADGSNGQGQAVALTGDTGYFWFFDPTNVEVILKVLEACGLNAHRWVFASGLTDVETNITVTDLVGGTTQIYSNPQSTAFRAIQDTAAFPCN